MEVARKKNAKGLRLEPEEDLVSKSTAAKLPNEKGMETTVKRTRAAEKSGGGETAVPAPAREDRGTQSIPEDAGK